MISISTPDHRIRFSTYLKVAIFTILLYSSSFGILFYKAFTHPNPPHTDFGLGFAFVLFVPPFILVLLLAFISTLVLIYLKKGKQVNKIIDLISRLLILPVGMFGLLCLLGTIVAIIKHV